jgi:hypothetical protein
MAGSVNKVNIFGGKRMYFDVRAAVIGAAFGLVCSVTSIVAVTIVSRSW